jgi:hypothetical protein
MTVDVVAYNRELANDAGGRRNSDMRCQCYGNTRSTIYPALLLITTKY